ncbi:hypothetical protein [Methanobacterium sp.]|uniref:hypothetical protein n=1 Tax=Methanobacterium sp. TaxID=2164 RepID=UPI003C707335
MDINDLIPEFLVLSLAGSSLSTAAYSSFRDRSRRSKASANYCNLLYLRILSYFNLICYNIG